MKVFLIFAALVAFSLATSDEDKIVQDYLEKFKIRVPRNSNVDKIRQNVLKRFRESETHNEKYRKGEENFFTELNELSWKDEDEIRATSLGFIDGPPTNKSNDLPINRNGRAAIPENFNWVNQGIVRPVQNQGNCGEK